VIGKADIYQELEWHKIATLRAIETGHIPMAERRLDSYVLFSKIFLRELDARGIKFTSKQARSVSYLDWPFAVQVIQHVHEVVLAALDTGNRQMIATVLYQPIRFMKMSVRTADFLFFKRVLRVYPMAIARSYNLPPGDVKSQVVDLSWRYLFEFSNLAFPELSQELDRPTATMFLSDIVWTFNDLLKVTIDHDDLDNYIKIGRELDRLFDWFRYATKVPWQSQEVMQEMDRQRQLVWFGLGSWLTRANVIEPKEAVLYEAKQTVNRLHLPEFLQPVTARYNRIRDLSQVYVNALQFEDRAVWDQWILEGLPEREVHSVDFPRWLTYFYCLQGIKLILPTGSDAADMPIADKNLKYRLDDIRAICQVIGNNPSKWIRIVTNEQIANWESFVNLNEQAVALYERHLQNRIIESSLSEAKLAEYKEEFLKGWNSNAWLDYLLKTHTKVVRQPASVDTKYLALYFRMLKEAFVDVQEAKWVGIGSQNGENLVRYVTSQYVDELLHICESSRIQSSISDLPHLLSVQLDDMTKAGVAPQITIIVGDYHLEQQLIENNTLVPRWSPECSTPKFEFSDYVGAIREIPVFRERRKNEASILLANLKLIGEYIIYEPQKDSYQDFLIRIRQLNQSEMDKLIEREIEENHKSDKPERSRDEIIRSLSQEVEIFAGFKAELNITRPDCVRRIDVM